jgi:5-methyltetrahydrofolate--homocysteine methyltransferase
MNRAETECERLVCLRQQADKSSENLCLADFIAPAESGVKDWVGLFAVTTGLGLEEAAAACRKRRLCRHHAQGTGRSPGRSPGRGPARKVRREICGLCPDEITGPEALIAEKYRGIPPGPRLSGLPRSQRKG